MTRPQIEVFFTSTKIASVTWLVSLGAFAREKLNEVPGNEAFKGYRSNVSLRVIGLELVRSGANNNISVDATSAPRKIFHASLKIPASAGKLTLYCPKWIPGEYAPDGPVVDLAGLKVHGGREELVVARDTWTHIRSSCTFTPEQARLMLSWTIFPRQRSRGRPC